MRRSFAKGLFILIFTSVLYSQELVGSVYLPAKVRDFFEYSSEDSVFTHPDFESYFGTGCKNAVLPTIGINGLSSTLKNDNKNPIFNPDVDCPTKQFTGAEYFDHWFNDYGSDINRSFLIYLKFDIYDDCKIRYENTMFTPIDDGKLFKSLSNPAEETFGHLHPFYPEHNWGFTMEFHTTFTYIQGANQVFNFSGDDDVWVFINDSLLVDLGGLHEKQSASVNLDELPPGFLINENVYDFDFFFAERHSYGSNLIIESGLLLGLNFEGIWGAPFSDNEKTRYTYLDCFGEIVEIPEDGNPLVTSVKEKKSKLAETAVFFVKNHQIFISLPGKKDLENSVKFEIYNVQGKLIRKEILNSNDGKNFYFPISKIASGCYIIVLKSGSEKITRRVLVKPQL